MIVYIPTTQRSHDLRCALDLVEAGLNVVLVVPKGEKKTYKAEWPHMIVEHPKGIGIALARQWIVDNAISDKIVMVDDDLSFHERRKDDPTKFKPAGPASIKRLFARLEKALDKYTHASVIARQGGNRVTGDLVCSRPWHVFAFNVPAFREAGVKYCKGLVQDDFDITLQLLRKGHKNIVLSGWAVNQHGGHGSPGGANTYRTLESHNASILKLQSRHPDFVRVRETDYKSGNGDWGQRLEATMAWKKAYAESQS